MDPLLLIAEWWWIAPSAAVGTVAVIGVRSRRPGGRRLALDAARHDLLAARRVGAERQMALRVARAEVARVAAERAAHRATPEQLAGSRRMLRERERDARVAAADVRARQVRVRAERAAVPAAAALPPLDRLRAEHAAVVARWMRYETDPALQISFPEMSDIRQSATSFYVRAAEHAVEMRRVVEMRTSPATFSAYRDAVAELERAFEAAEHSARSRAGDGPAWQDTAQDMLDRSMQAFERTATSVIASWSGRRNRRDRP